VTMGMTPTMDTLSCNRVVGSFPNIVKYIVYICHDYFISHFTNRFNYAEELDAAPEPEVLLPIRLGCWDLLNYLNFIWNPYNMERVAECTSESLVTGHTQASVYFLTTTTLVYDMAVEVHCPKRVQRKFGALQHFLRPRAIEAVPRDTHR
jgi:hypothetical protein